ncbi:MAG: hypothetical protein AABX32_06550 [Nanoarchaeota archaeon]
MKKGVVIGIIIIVIIGTISVYSIINQNSDTVNEIVTPDVIPETTGVNHSIELTEGITMTGP